VLNPTFSPALAQGLFFSALLIALPLLSGCGQKGPLILAKPAATANAPVASGVAR
jgi:predicted small lipoprotein YifL